MEEVNLSVVFKNRDHQNPCSFEVLHQPHLDFSTGDWFIALSAFDINYTIDNAPASIFILCDLIEPIRFGSRVRDVIHASEPKSSFLAQSELKYIKAKKTTHSYIVITIVDGDGRVVKTSDILPRTTITLLFKGFYKEEDEEEEESEEETT